MRWMTATKGSPFGHPKLQRSLVIHNGSGYEFTRRSVVVGIQAGKLLLTEQSPTLLKLLRIDFATRESLFKNVERLS